MLSNFLDWVTPKMPDKTFICRHSIWVILSRKSFLTGGGGGGSIEVPQDLKKNTDELFCIFLYSQKYSFLT